MLNFHVNRGMYLEYTNRFELCFWWISFYIIYDNKKILKYIDRLDCSDAINYELEKLYPNKSHKR